MKTVLIALGVIAAVVGVVYAAFLIGIAFMGRAVIGGLGKACTESAGPKNRPVSEAPKAA